MGKRLYAILFWVRYQRCLAPILRWGGGPYSKMSWSNNTVQTIHGSGIFVPHIDGLVGRSTVGETEGEALEYLSNY